jgi:hypothetical protein
MAITLVVTAAPVVAKVSSCVRSITQWTDKSGIGYVTATATRRGLTATDALDHMRALMLRQGATITIFEPADGTLTAVVPSTGDDPPAYDLVVTQNRDTTHLRLVYHHKLLSDDEPLTKTKTRLCRMLGRIG